jgi:hypothetical protein
MMRFRPPAFVTRFLLPLVGLAPVLAACGPKTNEFAPPCPTPAFLRDLSDIVRYHPNSSSRDLTDIVLRGRLTALVGKCEEGSKTVLNTAIEVRMDMSRGPAMEGRRADVPVFVLVLDQGEIVEKQIYSIRVDFPPNLDRALIASPPLNIALPITVEKSGAAYGIIVGYQLTPEELANNRRRSP